jgi:hypothetical protein
MKPLTAEWIAKAEGDFALMELSDFAVAYRYPGETSSKEQARDAIARCRRFRQAARQSLQLPS